MPDVPSVTARFCRENENPPAPNIALLPTVTEISSRMAGPTAREPCCIAWFRATALGSRSRSTRFGVNDCAAVICAVRNVPLITARTTTYHGLLPPVITRTAMTAAWAIWSTYTRCNSVLRVILSAR